VIWLGRAGLPVPVVPASSAVEATVDPVTTPIVVALDALAAAIKLAVDPITSPVETRIDPVTLAVQMSVDPVTTLIQTFGPFSMAGRARLLGQCIQPIVDPISARVQTLVHPIATSIEPFVDTAPARVEPIVYPIAPGIEPSVNSVAKAVVVARSGQRGYSATDSYRSNPNQYRSLNHVRFSPCRIGLTFAAPSCLHLNSFSL
jgi:hypothetical protein